MNFKILNYRDFLSGLSDEEKRKAMFIASVVWCKDNVLSRSFIYNACYNEVFVGAYDKFLVLVEKDCKFLNSSKIFSN